MYLDFFTACSFFKQDQNAGKLTFKLAEKSGGTSSSYEELVSDKQRMIPALLCHCGLDLEPATLEPHNTERLVTTNGVAQVRQPISPSAIGKAEFYRAHLKPFVAAYIYRG